MERKLASLDALRGLAILLVITAHFFAGLTGQAASILFGNAGVILFFFLSGFLMDRTLHLDPSVSTYAVRRAFRILPMYWISILLVALSTVGWSFGQILSNATFTATVFGSERMLGVYWTLYIEVLFYCFAPLLARAGSGVLSASTYALLILFAAVSLFHGVGKGAPFYLIFCLCGMQIGSWYREEISREQIWFSIFIACGSASLLLPVSIYLGPVALACAVLLIAALRFPVRFPTMEFFGRVSYSWYLLHSIFGYALTSRAMPEWLALLIGAVLTLGVSVLTHRYIELPAIAVGKLLVEQWRIRAYGVPSPH